MYTVKSITFNLDHEKNSLHFISNENLILSFACPSAKFSPLVFLWDSLFFLFFFFFFFNQYSSKSLINDIFNIFPQSWGLSKLDCCHIRRCIIIMTMIYSKIFNIEHITNTPHLLLSQEHKALKLIFFKTL